MTLFVVNSLIVFLECVTKRIVGSALCNMRAFRGAFCGNPVLYRNSPSVAILD
jgi:hypothetical protein